MAQFYRPKKKSTAHDPLTLTIDSLDHEGRGVARVNNKVCFVDGALPGERVSVRVRADKSRYMEATVAQIVEPSDKRIKPFCEYYGRCGGCQLQHLEPEAQLEYKQQAVGLLFAKFAGLEDVPWQAPLVSCQTHYRRSARVAVFFDRDNKKVRFGYRAAGSKKIVEVRRCDVLVSEFSAIFEVFEGLFAAHPALASVTHLQLVKADNGAYVVLRHTKAIAEKAKQAVADTCLEHEWFVVWQGAETEFDGAADASPYYELNKFNLRLYFGLNNFIQVNAEVNRAMLKQALDWLALQGDEQVLDLFCGIGNFSLTLAQKANRVVGVEGVESAVAVAKENAHYNGLSNAAFYCADLTQNLSKAEWFDRAFDVLVLDPSRTGAQEILAQLPLKQFKRILYVSCDPVTLARDSKLILDAGFAMQKAGIMNMFPHTGHIETMALFARV